jgi:hypothetical protein
MNAPLRHVVSELIDVEVEQPPLGTPVLALGRGGVLATVVWNVNSIHYFVAWLPRPLVPLSVLARLAYVGPVNDVNSKEN